MKHLLHFDSVIHESKIYFGIYNINTSFSLFQNYQNLYKVFIMLVIIILFVISVIYYIIHSKQITDHEFYILFIIFIILLVLLYIKRVREHFVIEAETKPDSSKEKLGKDSKEKTNKDKILDITNKIIDKSFILFEKTKQFVKKPEVKDEIKEKINTLVNKTQEYISSIKKSFKNRNDTKEK